MVIHFVFFSDENHTSITLHIYRSSRSGEGRIRTRICKVHQWPSILWIRCGITMTSWWPRWRLKSPAWRLFTQPFIQTQIKENIKAPRHWPLCGDFTGTGEFPAQRASYAENVSIWWCHHGLECLETSPYNGPCAPCLRITIWPYFSLTSNTCKSNTNANLALYVIQAIIVGTLMPIIVLGAALGIILVIASVLSNRKLRTIANIYYLHYWTFL